MKIFFKSFFIFFLLITPALGTTPTITGTSGEISQDSSVTITGTNMLDEDTTDWIMTEAQSHCDGANPAADGWDGGSSSYVTDVKLIGTKSTEYSVTGDGVEGDTCPADNEGDYIYRYIYSGEANLTTQYARAYVRYSSNFVDLFEAASYVKMFYWMTSGGYIQPDTTLSGWPTNMLIKIYADFTTKSLPDTWEGERWYCVEAKIVYDTTDYIEVWVDGEYIGKYENDTLQAISYWQFELGIINTCPVPNDTYTMWSDGQTLSESRIYPATLIEIGDSSTYATATKVTQELTGASDTSININCDLTGLGSGPYYLWVTNNQQERSDVYTFQTGIKSTASGSFNLH